MTKIDESAKPRCARAPIKRFGSNHVKRGVDAGIETDLMTSDRLTVHIDALLVDSERNRKRKNERKKKRLKNENKYWRTQFAMNFNIYFNCREIALHKLSYVHFRTYYSVNVRLIAALNYFGMRIKMFILLHPVWLTLNWTVFFAQTAECVGLGVRSFVWRSFN